MKLKAIFVVCIWREMSNRLNLIFLLPIFLLLISSCRDRILWSYSTEGAVYSSPAIGDIDGDEKLEVVVCSQDENDDNIYIYALNGENGSLLWFYTVSRNVSTVLGGIGNKRMNLTVSSESVSPALGDVDGDGRLEVVVTSPEGVYALNGEDGSLLWSSPGMAWEFLFPVLGDINDDGKLEVVIGWSPQVYVLNGEDGSLLWSFTTDGACFSPALGDVDGDGRLEVVVGCGERNVYALNGEDGSLLWAFTTATHDEWFYFSALGDVDGDGRLEVVVTSDALNGEHSSLVYALNGEDGSLLWSYATKDFVTYSSPALGDIDGDGKLEVVLTSLSRIYAFNGEDGSLLWFQEGWRAELSPSIGDIDGDGRLEIVGVRCSSHQELAVLNGEDGSLLWFYSLGHFGWVLSHSLGDVDGDGTLDVVVGSADYKVYAIKTDSSVPPPHLLPWPKYMHDVKNTGLYTGNPYPPW